jgi:hypothetical protein
MTATVSGPSASSGIHRHKRTSRETAFFQCARSRQQRGESLQTAREQSERAFQTAEGFQNPAPLHNRLHLGKKGAPMTVARYIGRTRDVKDADRIEKAIRELGYAPNSAAA